MSSPRRSQTYTNGHPPYEWKGDQARHPSTSIPIAVIGMSCRFSGDVTNPSKLWELCASGKDGWSQIPPERFSTKTTNNLPLGGYFLKEDISLFDAAFFNLSNEGASCMDPQLRLILESVYEATEDAGIPLKNLAGSNTSVFSGAYSKDFYDLLMRDPELLPLSFVTGNGTAMLSNRVAHFYDTRGPSMTVDTGCSSGLTAIHQGCQTLYTGESDISIVSAATVILNRDMLITMRNQGVLGDDGKCYSFDSRAHGYGRGEGVAAIVLKPLDAALRDGDNVYSIIRQTGLNQDGKTASITSPSMEAQLKLINQCYKQAGLDLSETAYVECHGTGTEVGDPIEAEAIARTFGASRVNDDPVYIGSVKTNIGHTEPVSGIVAVIKTSLALRNGLIPQSLNYETNNPKIPVDEWNLRVPTALTPWPSNKPLRASVNNFGYGGSNAHVIMESPTLYGVNTCSASNGVEIQEDDQYRVFVLSGKDSTSSEAIVKNTAAYIRQAVQNKIAPTLTNVAYTLSERRSIFPWLVAVRASNLSELADRLEDPALKPSHAARKPRLGFVFNGQGAQWYAMGRELIAAYSVFASAIQEGSQILKEYGASWSLYDELMRDEESTRVHETHISQPINVAVQLALVNLLRSWGISPSAVTSHSSGEIAAAYSVGVLSFKQALGVVYFRGELALKYQKLLSLEGGMLAAGLGEEEAEKYLVDTQGGHVVVSCINSPDSVTLSGDTAALDEVAGRLEKDGIFARKLKVPLAYHSHHMLHMAQEYNDVLRRILPVTDETPTSWSGPVFASPVTGQVLTSPSVVLSPEHWVSNLTSPVRFAEAFENMCSGSRTSDESPSISLSVDAILEVGAHSTLSGPIRSILKDRSLPYLSCLKRSADACQTMQEVACALVRQGYPVDFAGVNEYSAQHHCKLVQGLPTYAWNHTKKYWTEPRVSREHRFGKIPPHELLGSHVAGDNDSNFTWRNFLRVSDIPWLVDHRIESKIVLPGAAYVSMAIEAIRIITDSSEESIRGYRIRDVDITNALVIPESSTGIETRLHLHPCSEKELDYKGWYEFELSSLASGDHWTSHCKGSVSAESTTAVRAATATEEQPPNVESFFPADARANSADLKAFFSELREIGFYHGPMFQNLVDSRAFENKSITTLSVSKAASEVDDYVLHPATLDSIIQAAYVDMAQKTSKDSMRVPRSIRTMFVPRGIKRLSGEKLQAFTELVKSDKRGSTVNISVVNQEINKQDSASSLQIHGFHVQAIARDLSDQVAEENSVCFKSRWELDVLHNVPSAIKDAMQAPIDPQEADFENKSVRASYHFICDALTELKDDNRDDFQWHHKIYDNWMKAIVALGASGKLAPGSKSWAKTSAGLKQMLIDELSQSNAVGKMICRVGPKLAEILRGGITPLELMLKDDLLNQYYMEMPRFKNRVYKHLSKVAELYAIKNPGANVLEIGAGTGGSTGAILEAFASRGDGSGTLLGHYDFTDISSGFFEAGRQKFSGWANVMDFKKLDIEVDPVEQSFVAGSYDLIVASAVLHATKSLNRTLANVRKLLKPGGKLILLECIQDRLDSQLIFGTLPGWWLAEEPDRKMSPNVPLATWDRVLLEENFTGVDFDVPDFEEPEFTSATLIITTAKSEPPPKISISIVYTDRPPEKWLESLSHAINDTMGAVPTVESLAEADTTDKLCIFTADLGSPFLETMDAKLFTQVQNLLVNSRGILWLSCSGSIDSKQPLFAQTNGLLRTIAQEDLSKRCVHLDLELPGDPGNIKHITHVLRQNFDYGKDVAEVDSEYAVKDDMLHVPRIFTDKAANNAASKTPADAPAELEGFYQGDRVLTWENGTTGLLSDGFFTDDHTRSGEVPEGVVQIEPRAFGLNFRDVLVALGQVDEELHLYKHEVSGIVKRLGPGTEESGLCVGDRVCGAGQGQISNLSHSFWKDITKIPDSMSFTDAATLPTIYATVLHALNDIARLERGETVLIHAGTGGVGQAAIMLAQHLGAQVFATCSTLEKRDFLVERYNLRPDHIFSSRDASFAPAIMAATGGVGVDVILNSLAGPLLEASWKTIARFGRFVEIGKADADAGRHLEMTPFRRCATYSCIDILQMAAYQKKDHVFRQALSASLRLCDEGVLRPVHPITIFPISDVEGALRHMQSGKHIGKLVLVPSPDDQVKVITRPRPVSLANPDATYLVVGGVTGIGRAIVKWMVKKGAKNILVTSRHAAEHPDAPSLTSEVRSDGCNIEIRDCDISDEQSFLKLVSDCAGTLPPIRGVVTTAMVLDDTVFERMTYDQWRHAILPKVAGTLNLHRHLPDQSFFIMMSSLAGIFGNLSQANYNAGNTFQDVLSRHRTALGQPAMVLDLGEVKSVGFVAEKNESERQRINKALGQGSGAGPALELDHLLRMVEAAIRQPLQTHPEDSQVITCLASWDAAVEGSAMRTDKRFSTLRLAIARTSQRPAARGVVEDAGALLAQALSGSTVVDATHLIVDALVQKMADIFNIVAAEIDVSLPMANYGVDSLVAVELRNWLSSVTRSKVTVFEILQSSSLAGLAELVAGRSELILKQVVVQAS